jgi:hypothetical protein
VTHTVTFPQGDTQALHISCDIKSDMQFGSAEFEGIGPAVYAYRRDGTSNNLQVIWQRRPDTEGDPSNWIHEQSGTYRRVIFVVQFPDGVRPEFVNIHWMTKGFAGQTRFANFAARDYFKRTYKAAVPDDTFGLTAFTNQYAPGWIHANIDRGISLGQNIYALYFDSFSVNIPNGTPIRLTADAAFGDFRAASGGTRLASAHGLALKVSRGPDVEWIKAYASDLLEDGANQRSSISISSGRITQRPITLIEPLLWWVSNGTPDTMRMIVDGGLVTVEIDDSALSGIAA